MLNPEYEMAATLQHTVMDLDWPKPQLIPDGAILTHDTGDIVVSRAFGMGLMTSMAVQPTSLWTRKRCFTLYAYMCSPQIDTARDTVPLKY